VHENKQEKGMKYNVVEKWVVVPTVWYLPCGTYRMEQYVQQNALFYERRYYLPHMASLCDNFNCVLDAVPSILTVQICAT
jgi:hypothetical protein